MDFKTHLRILRTCKIYRSNISKGSLIRQIYLLIDEHKGKDFKDLDDLFSKLYPEPIIKCVARGLNVRRRRRPRRESAFYNTEVHDLEEEAEHG